MTNAKKANIFVSLVILFSCAVIAGVAGINGCGTSTSTSLPGLGKIIFQGYRDVLDADWRRYGELYSVNEDGSNVQRITNNLFLEDQPDVSPDGTKIVCGIHFAPYNTMEAIDPGWEIAVMDIDGSNLTRLTSNEWIDIGAHWNHDGTKIVFISDSAKRDWNDINAGVPLKFDIYTMDPDGSNIAQLTNANSDEVYADPSFSFNSPSKILYIHSASSPHDDYDLWAMDENGSNKTLLLAHGGSLEAINDPMFNPEASRILFEADIGNDAFGNPIYNMFTVDSAGGDLTSITTNDGESDGLAQYSPDGTKMAYMSVKFYALGAGTTEIRTADFDGSSEKTITSAAGDSSPSWFPIN